MYSCNTLDEWIIYLEGLHHQPIDLGLERIHTVRLALGLVPTFPIITVGGTNGKGSVCAMLSTILHQAGYKVGTYTSPHVLRYNERIAINLCPINDQALMQHLAAINRARDNTTLTFFEFLTLAAMRYFMEAKVDVAVLEVGLGGRLDAVNTFDGEAAIVTNVNLDHCDWLGNTREAIGYEKAGIFRSRCPAIIGENNPPQSLLDYAKSIEAITYIAQRDFSAVGQPKAWDFKLGNTFYSGLCTPHLSATYQMGNAALALTALHLLREQLPISLPAIRQGLLQVQWPYRLQHLPSQPSVVLDVAHNPHAVATLVTELALLPSASRQIAVFSMLSDKDIAAVLQLAKAHFEVWYIAGLPVERGLTTEALKHYFDEAHIQAVYLFDNLKEAWHAAIADAFACDRIVVFGSFYTIAAVVEHIRKTE